MVPEGNYENTYFKIYCMKFWKTKKYLKDFKNMVYLYTEVSF